MLKTISRAQRNRLKNDLKEKIREVENENYILTFQDSLILLLLDRPAGIEKYGYEITEIMELLGLDKNDFKALTKIRSQVCNSVQSMVKEGYPIGGLKVGKYKKYGWSTPKEFDKLQLERKSRVVAEITNCLNYLDETDNLTRIGRQFKITYEKQLKLFEE